MTKSLAMLLLLLQLTSFIAFAEELESLHKPTPFHPPANAPHHHNPSPTHAHTPLHPPHHAKPPTHHHHQHPPAHAPIHKHVPVHPPHHAKPPTHHHHQHPPSHAPIQPPTHHHHHHSPAHTPIHKHVPVHPPHHAKPPTHHHHQHPPSHAPVQPPTHHHHPPTHAPVHKPVPVHPPHHAKPPTHHHHQHPPSHASVQPPTHHHHHHHPPAHSPVPIKYPTPGHHPHHHHAPAPAPVNTPLRQIFHAKRLLAVQGVVYVKSCKHAGVDTLLGATSLHGAVVKLQCNNTKHSVSIKGETDKNGYFYIKGSKDISSFAAHKCNVVLVSASKGLKPSNLNGGIDGAVLKLKKSFVSKGHPFILYNVGPLAFEPKCPR